MAATSTSRGAVLTLTRARFAIPTMSGMITM